MMNRPNHQVPCPQRLPDVVSKTMMKMPLYKGVKEAEGNKANRYY